jgi:putative FmdB family regulatory protein
MPTYDYKCANCGHVVEVVRGVNEAGPTVCPECGGLLRKQMSAPAIHFRGTGWAKKDARQAIAARAGKTESGDSLKSGESGKSGDSGKSAESGKSKEGAAGGGQGISTGAADKSGDKDGGKSQAGSSVAASGKE